MPRPIAQHAPPAACCASPQPSARRPAAAVIEIHEVIDPMAVITKWLDAPQMPSDSDEDIDFFRRWQDFAARQVAARERLADAKHYRWTAR